MAKLITIKDKLGNTLLPRTRSTGVYTDSNITLEQKLGNIDATLSDKVDKITGKGLSTEDYTTGEKAKVANLPLNTNAQLAEKANKVQEAWITPTLQNGYTVFNTWAVKYRKDSMGRVFLRGSVQTGATGQACLTLPVGYRPSIQRYFSLASASGIAGRGYVDSNGLVVVTTYTTFASLDSIVFDAEV